MPEVEGFKYHVFGGGKHQIQGSMNLEFQDSAAEPEP